MGERRKKEGREEGREREPREIEKNRKIQMIDKKKNSKYSSLRNTYC